MTKTLFVTLSLLAAHTLFASANEQSQKSEWEVLNQEVKSLYDRAYYGKAVIIAEKALQVAERASEPDHASVAAS